MRLTRKHLTVLILQLPLNMLLGSGYAMAYCEAEINKVCTYTTTISSNENPLYYGGDMMRCNNQEQKKLKVFIESNPNISSTDTETVKTNLARTRAWIAKTQNERKSGDGQWSYDYLEECKFQTLLSSQSSSSQTGTAQAGQSGGNVSQSKYDKMTASQLKAQADKLIKQGDNETALVVLNMLLDKYPKHKLAKQSKVLVAKISGTSAAEDASASNSASATNGSSTSGSSSSSSPNSSSNASSGSSNSQSFNAFAANGKKKLKIPAEYAMLKPTDVFLAVWKQRKSKDDNSDSTEDNLVDVRIASGQTLEEASKNKSTYHGAGGTVNGNTIISCSSITGSKSVGWFAWVVLNDALKEGVFYAKAGGAFVCGAKTYESAIELAWKGARERLGHAAQEAQLQVGISAEADFEKYRSENRLDNVDIYSFGSNRFYLLGDNENLILPDNAKAFVKLFKKDGVRFSNTPETWMDTKPPVFK